MDQPLAVHRSQVYGGEDAGADTVDLVSLVERIRTGEPAAMALLYHLVHRRVVQFFQRSLGVQDAEDQAHDTFLVVVEAIRRRSLRSAEALLAFVHTIARRRLAQEIEGVILARQRLVPGEACPVADWRCNPEQRAIASEQALIARRALEKLGTTHREVLWRFYLQGESAEQICAEMNLTGTQFRLLKWRAKNRFSKVGQRLKRATAPLRNAARGREWYPAGRYEESARPVSPPA